MTQHAGEQNTDPNVNWVQRVAAASAIALGAVACAAPNNSPVELQAVVEGLHTTGWTADKYDISDVYRRGSNYVATIKEKPCGKGDDFWLDQVVEDSVVSYRPSHISRTDFDKKYHC